MIAPAAAGGVKVYIMMGQSKMVGSHLVKKQGRFPHVLAVSGETGKHPEFAGNVKAIDARPFWRDAAVSPAHRQGHHSHHNAETYLSVGDALGHAMAGLIRGAE